MLSPIDFSFNYERIGPILEVYAHVDPIDLAFSYQVRALSKMIFANTPILRTIYC